VVSLRMKKTRDAQSMFAVVVLGKTDKRDRVNVCMPLGILDSKDLGCESAQGTMSCCRRSWGEHMDQCSYRFVGLGVRL